MTWIRPQIWQATDSILFSELKKMKALTFNFRITISEKEAENETRESRGEPSSKDILNRLTQDLVG